MDNYFNIRYEFDRGEVHKAIARRVEMPGAIMCAWPTG